MSAVRQFRAEGERPLKVPSPPAPTAVFTGVGGRARLGVGSAETNPTARLDVIVGTPLHLAREEIDYCNLRVLLLR